MYSTCIFCTRSLGHNDALEHFPVGRRLAFDAVEGELAGLEDAWREAEEIGAIADDMFLPSSIEQALVRLRLR